MSVYFLIKQRLQELGLEQKDLATAAGVTDSYISQLLNRKKLPPAPDRTDLYIKMGKFLKLPAGKLSELAEHERVEELKKELSETPVPLFKEVRELVLRKCAPEKRSEIGSILKSNRSANWSASSLRSSWTSSRRSPGRNWKARVG